MRRLRRQSRGVGGAGAPCSSAGAGAAAPGLERNAQLHAPLSERNKPAPRRAKRAEQGRSLYWTLSHSPDWMIPILLDNVPSYWTTHLTKTRTTRKGRKEDSTVNFHFELKIEKLSAEYCDKCSLTFDIFSYIGYININNTSQTG